MKRIGKTLCAIPVVLAILGTILVNRFEVSFVEIQTGADFQFGLMTVNALFGGFLYSNYGMLVGFRDNDVIMKLKGTRIMERRNTMVLAGIVYATLSVVCGLYISLIDASNNYTNKWLLSWAINGEIVFMVAAIVFYLLSLATMNQLVKELYNTTGILGKRKINQIKEKITSISREEFEK